MPVIVRIEGFALFSALDVVSILDRSKAPWRIWRPVGRRSEEAVYKCPRVKDVHPPLHKELHQRGQFYEYTPVTQHS